MKLRLKFPNLLSVEQLPLLATFFVLLLDPLNGFPAPVCDSGDFNKIALNEKYATATDSAAQERQAFIDSFRTAGASKKDVVERIQAFLRSRLHIAEQLSDQELEHFLRRDIEGHHPEGRSGIYPAGLVPEDIPKGEDPLEIMLLEFVLSPLEDKAKNLANLSPELRAWAETVVDRTYRAGSRDPRAWNDLLGQTWGNVNGHSYSLIDFLVSKNSPEVAEMFSSSLFSAALWEEARRRISRGDWTSFGRPELATAYQQRFSDPEFLTDNPLAERGRNSPSSFSWEPSP